MTASLRRCRDRLVVRLWWRTWTGRIPTAARAGNAVRYGAQAGVRDRGYDLRKRMRLRGLSGARDEFHLAAIVQNLKTLANPRWSRILESAIWLRTLSRSSGSAISSGVSPTRSRRGATGTPAPSRRANLRYRYTLSIPTRRSWAACCARAARGHAATPPSSVMNSRLFIRSPRRRWQARRSRGRSTCEVSLGHRFEGSDLPDYRLPERLLGSDIGQQLRRRHWIDIACGVLEPRLRSLLAQHRA
jgi:hypothetical protein